MGLEIARQPPRSSDKAERDGIGPSAILMSVLREVRMSEAAARRKRFSEDTVDFKFESGRLLVHTIGSRKLVVMMCIDKPQFSWISRAPLGPVASK